MTTRNVLFLSWGEGVYDSGIFANLILEQLVSMKKYTDLSLRVLCGVPVFTRKSLFQREEWRKSKRRFLDLFEDAGFPPQIRNLPVPSSFFRSRFWELPFLYVGHVRFLSRYLRHNSIDAVLCRSYHSTALALLSRAAFRLKSRIIFDPRSTLPEEVVLTGRAGANSISLRLWRRIEKALLGRCDTVVTVSEGLAEHFLGRCPTAKCVTIYASIDVSRLVATGPGQPPAQGGPPELAYIGNIANESFHSISYLAAVYKAYRAEVGGAARLLIITKADHNEVARSLLAQGVAEDELTIRTAHSIVECNHLLRGSTHTVVPFKCVESPFDEIMASTMIGSKVPEYLAARKPILYNKSVLSLHRILAHSTAGIAFTVDDGNVKFERPIDPEDAGSLLVEAECERLARGLFDVRESSKRYHDVLVGGS